jgi:hypothetical protein
MKLEILRSVMISGESAAAGSFVEVSNADAQILLGLGKARKAEEAEKVVKAEAPKEEPKPKRTRSAAPKE